MNTPEYNRAYYQRNREKVLAGHYAWRRNYPEKALAVGRTPRACYAKQRVRARARGIEWQFTFETWWAIWEKSWFQRGNSPHQLCMARNGDVGPYAPGNVSLITNKENNSDQYNK